MLNFLCESNQILKNKYFKWYCSIISNAQNRNLEFEYNEKHHIIPQAIFDTIIIDTSLNKNDSSNIIKLTAREHFIAHMLLVRFTINDSKRKMIFALHAMSNQENQSQERYKINSTVYEQIKRNFVNNIKGSNHWTKTATKEKLSNSVKKREANMSDESKEKRRLNMSIALKGKKKSDIHKQKISESTKGVKKTKTEKLLKSYERLSYEMSHGNRNPVPKGSKRELSPCPICGKLVDVANMKRWHGDNCKLKISLE